MEFTQREVVLVEEGVCPFCTGMLKEKIMPGACLYIARSGREQFANDRKTV